MSAKINHAVVSERPLLNHALLVATQLGARLFRNNVGQGWVGKVVYRGPRTITLDDPRPLQTGLCVGSSDLIGWRPVTITPEMVGQTLAVFCAVEMKGARGVVTDEQRRFIDAVRVAGGRAGAAYSIEEATAILSADNK
jgi:hypothetical protein